jgi:hypothetical protein
VDIAPGQSATGTWAYYWLSFTTTGEVVQLGEHLTEITDHISGMKARLLDTGISRDLQWEAL